MTAKDIANKIALLKGALKKEKNANAKKIIQKKIENLRTQAKTSNISTTALAKQLLGSTRKVANMTDAELQSAINQLKPRSEYAFLKGRIYVKGGVGVKYNLKKVKDDLERYAKPVGWRIKGANNTHRPTPTELAKAKKKGTAYYEDRPDRSDVVRPARLEDGGMMAKGGNVEKGSAHLYIDLRNGNVRIIHGDSVTLKGNPYVVEEVKNVKEGEWLKMVAYILNLKTVK